MNKTLTALGLAIATGIAASSALASAIVYPAKGQSNEQMEKDKSECYGWAQQQSGFDPANPPKVTVQQAQSGSTGRGVAGGAARGAALGAIGGAIAGNAGKGAAIGAATGGAFGGMRSRQSTRHAQNQYEQQVQQQQAQIDKLRDTYDRAFKACMSGRGYTIN